MLRSHVGRRAKETHSRPATEQSSPRPSNPDSYKTSSPQCTVNDLFGSKLTKVPFALRSMRTHLSPRGSSTACLRDALGEKTTTSLAKSRPVVTLLLPSETKISPR